MRTFSAKKGPVVSAIGTFALATLGPAPAARATYPGSNGAIAFVTAGDSLTTNPNARRIAGTIVALTVGLLSLLSGALGSATPAVSAATQTPVSDCQGLSVPGAYVLTADLASVDATCIEITASNVKLDLAGHTMTCTGSGFAGSCQVAGFGPHGVYVPPDLSLTGVVIAGPGTINGFDNGVTIVGSDALVKGITFSGPACNPSDCVRPTSNGIIVIGTLIGDPTQGIADLGPANVTLMRNQVSNHARGIGLLGPQCTEDSGCLVSANVVHDDVGANICFGIQVAGVTGYSVRGNVAASNGGASTCFPGAGIAVSDESTGNVLTRNDASNNRGFGIVVGPGTNGNLIANNTARTNAFVDLRGFPGTVNSWLDNNRCNTESGAVPSSVCNPGE